MGQPARYMFDEVFALAKVGEPEPPRFEQEELDRAAERARQEGFTAGEAAGRAAALARIEHQLANACDRLFDTLPGLIAAADGHRRIAEDAAIDVGVQMARKLARALVARYPLVEVVDLFRQAVDEVRAVPHVVLRVHESLTEPLSERIAKLARETGVEGRVIVMGDPDIVPGDARLEWADGGMVRDTAELEARVEDAVKRFALRRPQMRPGHPEPMPDAVSGAAHPSGEAAPAVAREKELSDGQ
ncbi:MAG: flagellar assembly protein FliH [Rhodobiaceae bacterium]|nr:flagellar assembly protein FliH [Rhodobiaceae bacterium]MCC0015375.1 flagellar assembly protein FliH [Rhodobiaceae bacterium]MCC0041984.1 flagellar assembly protein FliH [Rhodobiaceae bacterium]MCC0053386.1 flagellar assembly protein FliH [Rhodobiaceae bacterium]